MPTEVHLHYTFFLNYPQINPKKEHRYELTDMKGTSFFVEVKDGKVLFHNFIFLSQGNNLPLNVVIPSKWKIAFTECIFEDPVLVDDNRTSSAYDTLEFDNVIFKKDVIISQRGFNLIMRKIAGLTINVKSRIDSLLLEKIKLENLLASGYYKTISIFGHCRINNIDFQTNFEALALHITSLKDCLNFKASQRQNMINWVIDNSEITGLFSITTSTNGKIIVRGCEIEKMRVDLSGSKGTSILALNTNIGHFHPIFGASSFDSIEVAPEILKELKVSLFTQIDTIELSGILVDGAKFWVDQTFLSHLIFDRFENRGSLRFREVRSLNSESSLLLKQASLGKAEFHNFDFSIGQLEFNKSQITDIFVTNSDFPRELKTKQWASMMSSKGSRNFSQAMSFFGQLQTVFQKNGDSVRAYDANSFEIEFYHKTLPKKGYYFTRLNLWLNKISSTYGRNWSRGVAFTFGCALISYTCVITFGNSFFSIYGNPEFDSLYFSSFFKYLNPFRNVDLAEVFKFDNKSLVKLNAIAYGADFLGRVLVAYGYYQTIQAFRRYGRK